MAAHYLSDKNQYMEQGIIETKF